MKALLLACLCLTGAIAQEGATPSPLVEKSTAAKVQELTKRVLDLTAELARVRSDRQIFLDYMNLAISKLASCKAEMELIKIGPELADTSKSDKSSGSK